MNSISICLLLAAAVFAILPSPAQADLIELKDGRKIDGSMSRQGDTMVIKSADGASLVVAPTDVTRVTLTTKVTPEEASKAEWTRLVLQIKQADDLPTVMAIHEKFLKSYPDVPLAKDVRDSLGVYQKLAAGKAVKFRGRWMPPEQVDVTLKMWTESARPAVDFYKAGRLKETLDTVKNLLADDDANPDALALGGLAAYRMNNFPLSKTYFTALTSADPGSVLAENNLGVLLFQQKAQAEGLMHYTKALQIMPDHRLVLDNIAEAINAYTGSKNSAAYRGLMRQYEQAETKAEALMATKGLHRWGSTWVTPGQLDRLVKQKNSVQDQMAQLEAQYKFATNSLAGLDAQIRQAQSDYENAQSNFNAFTAQVQLLQDRAIDTVLAVTQREAAWQQMNQAQRLKATLEAQRDQLNASLRDFYVQADKLKAALIAAQSQYSGIQRIMDLGEVQNPPPPTVVAIPAEVPPVPKIIMVNQGTVPTPSAPSPVIVVQDPGFGRGNAEGRGRGRGGSGRGRGGNPDTTQPATQPGTQPATN